MQRYRGMGSVYKRGRIWWIKYYHNKKPYYESSKSTRKIDATKLLKKRNSFSSEDTIGDHSWINSTINNLFCSNPNSRKVSLRLRVAIFQRDGGRCVRCGRSARETCRLEVDHIIPWENGGKTVAENLQVLCFKCNRGKSNLFAG